MYVDQLSDIIVVDINIPHTSHYTNALLKSVYGTFVIGLILYQLTMAD